MQSVFAFPRPERGRRLLALRALGVLVLALLSSTPVHSGWALAAQNPAPEPPSGQSPESAPGAESAGQTEPAAEEHPAVATNPGRARPQLAEYFQQQVLPILEQNCLKCHGGGDKLRGNLSLTSREGLLRGGDLGPAVDLENLEGSLLLEAVRYESLEMPPSGKLSEDQIAVISRWVKDGAAWTPGREMAPANNEAQHGGEPVLTEDVRNFWSFRPVVRPEVPRLEDPWAATPIDAFVLARLQQQGLSPSPPADRVSLLRRAYYDLIGLPPSPDEVAEFLSDESPEAFARVIDRLLESPQYGIRWGRHWLDLVRYAESNSYERDNPKPFVWRYRDYVVDAFNSDKPYDEFIREQLAGDELEPMTPERLIATGYYRLGIWDDEPADPELALYDDLDDIVGTTSQVFLGLTLNCARCHDHKLDPIPQRDYYRFLAFFNGVTRFGVRSNESIAENSLRYPLPPSEHARMASEKQQYEHEIRRVEQQLREIEKLAKQDFEPVEHEEFKHEQHRIPLLKKRVPQVLSQAQFDRYVELTEQLGALRAAPPQVLEQVLCVTEVGREPRATHILIRGNPHAQGELVQPGWPQLLGGGDAVLPAPDGDAQSSLRRRVLADWIASPDNPLTSRVMANRLWQYHFGRGLVRSPNNFGLQGDRPTHPELLDYLASELVQGGWRLKRMHKMIMLSRAYQMSSAPRLEASERDPENHWFWRFDPRRLEAEEIRDSVLAVNGTLNLAMGGPSIYPTIPQEVLAGQSRPGAGWGVSSPEDQARRSIYIHLKRSLITPIIAAFDGPDPDFTCPTRFSSTQPTQALLMLNSDFMNQQAARFAQSLQDSAGSDPADQVRLALQRVTQREPSGEEVQRGVALLRSLEEDHQVAPDRALTYFCLLALNLNEFLYLD